MNTAALDVLISKSFILKPEQQQSIEVCIPEDGIQKFHLVFTEDSSDEMQASVNIKGGVNQATFIFQRWAEVSEFELPQPKAIGCTDHSGRMFYVHFSIHTQHDYHSERTMDLQQGDAQLRDTLIRQTTYHLNFQVLIDPSLMTAVA